MNTENSVVVTCSTQVTMPLLVSTIGADGTKLDFTEIRKKYGYRPVQGLPLPQPRKKP